MTRAAHERRRAPASNGTAGTYDNFDGEATPDQATATNVFSDQEASGSATLEAASIGSVAAPTARTTLPAPAATPTSTPPPRVPPKK